MNLKALIAKLTGNQPQNAPTRVIETTLGSLYQALQAGTMPHGDNVVVITQLGKVEWLQPTRGGFTVMLWGANVVKTFGYSDLVEVVYG
jgi:hypothetical protein